MTVMSDAVMTCVILLPKTAEIKMSILLAVSEHTDFSCSRWKCFFYPELFYNDFRLMLFLL